jgi:DNA-directed RNA polymerase omega subunit
MPLRLLYNSNIKEKQMARFTSEEAAQQAGGLYDLVLIATIRARELKRGHLPLVSKVGGYIVTALREIEAGKIDRKEYLAKLKK